MPQKSALILTLGLALTFGHAMILAGSGFAGASEKRSIPAPASVSPEAQAFLNQPITRGETPVNPDTDAEWIALREQRDGPAAAALARILPTLPVSMEETEWNGVTVRIVRPKNQPAEKTQKVLMNVHGGGYVFGGGLSSLRGALPFAIQGGYTVVAVDYRMPPEHPHPAAVDDAVTVYKELLKTHQPEDIAIFGTSAGGSLAASAVLAARDQGLPLPAAVLMNTPWSDLTKTGDSYATLAGLDPVLVDYDGLLATMARIYAGDEDMKHPLLSPVYADYDAGFPPSFLLTGTRDLFLSNTVRHHRVLRDAGIEADLHVYEGMWHAFTGIPQGLPEGQSALTEMIDFFDRHLID